MKEAWSAMPPKSPIPKKLSLPPMGNRQKTSEIAMSFDTNQLAYKDFRETLKQNTRQVVVWAGAGMSAPAELPSWNGLRSYLVGEAEKKASLYPDLSHKIHALLERAKGQTDLWKVFGFLKTALGEASFPAAIRSSFAKAADAEPPILYKEFWSLGVTAFLNLNIDRLATRAFSEVSREAGSRQGLKEFDGVNVNQHLDVLKSGSPFIANLHGTLENQQSWIFTNDELDSLISKQGYKILLNTCFTTKTVLFVGISADDQAAGGHLEQLAKSGISVGDHFWLTNRNDAKTNEWAEKAGIRQIIYGIGGNSHTEINEFVADLRRYIPPDPPALPVTPPTHRKRGVKILPPEEIERLKSNEIREILNSEAVRILGSQDPNRYTEYEKFWTTYEEAISRAWIVKTTTGNNKLFDYELQSTIAKGAFGYVYKAIGISGKEVAIKILHGNVTEEPQMLECFRRGVDAMQILSKNNVKGMVPYIETWEIPACTVMELINGPNLEQAVEWNYVDSWQMLIRIAIDLVSIIRMAHQLPQRVLHRDMRPANVMLKDYDAGADRSEVVVLDFDLSWHRDASGLSVNLGKSTNGYLAPEQLDISRKKLTRNALVDSFGMGMTLLFLASGKHPKIEEHNHPQWGLRLKERVEVKECSEWVSLPRRYARLIEWATKDKQHDRWDMTRILGELKRLAECARSPFKVESVELLCEEIAARCENMSKIYTWDNALFSAVAELKSGFTVTISPQDANRRVICLIEWFHMGDRPYKDVRKYVGNASTKVTAQMKSGGWSVSHIQVAHDRCRIESQVGQNAVNSILTLERCAKAISDAIHTLRFD